MTLKLEQIHTGNDDTDHNPESRLGFERNALSEDLLEKMNVEPSVVEKNTLLSDYLQSFLIHEQLVFRAISSLQLQGYQAPILPEGYHVSVEQGHLHLYQVTEDGHRDYYQLDSGEEAKGLAILMPVTHTNTLYFESGRYKKPISEKKMSQNLMDAQKMVGQALEEGSFAKLTGAVNGVTISQRVKLGNRHKIAAQELLFLLENNPSVFDAETLSWIHQPGNVDALKAVSRGEWSAMNRLGTEAFKNARSADGVIQLTLAWRRLRSALPKTMVRNIRQKKLETEQLKQLQMRLIQTESRTGKALEKDRRVVVERVKFPSVPGGDEPLSQAPKSQVEMKDPVSDNKEAEAEVGVSEEVVGIESQKDDLEKDPIIIIESDTPEIESEESHEEVDFETDESSENPQEIAQKSWEEQMTSLNALVSDYPGISITFLETGAFNRRLKLSNTSDFGSLQGPVETEHIIDVTLPKVSGELPVYRNGEKALTSAKAVFNHFFNELKEDIKYPVKEKFDSLLQEELIDWMKKGKLRQVGENRMSRRKKRRQVREGNLDDIIPHIRRRYGKKSLKLEALVSAFIPIETTLFEGGLIGGEPVEIKAVKQNDEIGLKISKGKTERDIFYSLQSDAKYEL